MPQSQVSLLTENASQTGQSSSSQSGQSTQGQAAAQGDGSNATQQQGNQQQTNNDNGGQQQQAAPHRPAYVPESAWDATVGKVIEDKFAAHVGELTAFKAAEDSRKLTIPKPEAYEVALPQDFKAPEGLKFELNKDDPIIAQARAIANKRGLDQEGFSEFLGLYAATKIGEHQQFKTAFDAEIGKLGATGPARITAIQTWLDAVGGKESAALSKVLQMAPVADTVVALENLMKKFSSQGGANFTQNGRAGQEPKGEIPGYENMSFQQRRAAQMNQKAG